MAIYQSQHKGEIIDEAVKRVLDILINKTSILPVEVGGTGQTSIAGIKSMLGMDETQYDVQPVNKGGTGATTAANARTNLGVTPDAIGAVKKSGDNMTGSLSVEKSTYPQFVLLANTPDTKAFLQIEGSSTQIINQNSISDSSNGRMLSLSNSKGQADVKNALRLLDKVDGTWHNYIVLTTANAAEMIQSLLTGGSISVVKSVQRGTYTTTTSTSGTITISSVDVNKSFVLVNGCVDGGSSNEGTSSAPAYKAYVGDTSVSLSSSTQLTVKNQTGTSGATIAWQVVEFY